MITGKCGNWECIATLSRQTSHHCSGLFLAKSVLRMLSNCYLSACDQNSYTAVGFNDPDFQYYIVRIF